MRRELSTHPNKTGQGGRRLRGKLGRGVWMPVWARLRQCLTHTLRQNRTHTGARDYHAPTHTHTCLRKAEAITSLSSDFTCVRRNAKKRGRCGGVVALQGRTHHVVPLHQPTHHPTHAPQHTRRAAHTRHTTRSTHQHEYMHTRSSTHGVHKCTRGAAHTNTSPLSARFKSQESYPLMHTGDKRASPFVHTQETTAAQPL
jgi:hypothetical protein